MNVEAQEFRAEDKFVTVDGLRIRYFEAGEGPPLVFVHGGSLGSSADVFTRNVAAFADAGFRAISFDQPGFGLSDVPEDLSTGYRRDFIPKFLDALGLERVAIAAHSQAGSPVVNLALEDPDRYSRIIVLGTGSLLPRKEGEGRDAAAQARLERRMSTAEPSIEDTRKLLEANLFHHELITPEELEIRHRNSIGRNFEAFVARQAAGGGNKAKKPDGTPLWDRLIELKMPLLMIYGRNDRANAEQRALELKEKYPSLNIHLVEGCKHLVPWDAACEFLGLAVPFLKS
jgi:4,5:9,10-diseco-3-hydroxy-5,9,17-trioxoandrosta-1(10),2-diene-4-oate hydrolase